MDVSNLTITGQARPAAGQVPGVAETSKPAAVGNPLPVSGQVRAPSGAPQNAASSTPANTDELHNLVEQANEAIAVRFSNLKFSVAEGTNINVVRIEDSETGELIQQIPSEQMVALARALDEIKQGMMLKEKV